MYALNNPVFFIDPDGMEARAGGVGFLSGLGAEIAGVKTSFFDGPIAPNRKAGRKKVDFSKYLQGLPGSVSSPPDDITVNSSGIVTNVVKNGKPNRFFDESGQQLFFNDPKTDFGLINDWAKGDRLYFPISNKEVDKAHGIGSPVPLMLRYTGNVNLAWFSAGVLSHTKADFTMSYLVPNYFALSDKQSLDVGRTRVEYIGNMHFFRFGNSKSIYNLYDAGNFLWGGWMHKNGFSYGAAEFGSLANELFGDSDSDQRAIKNGYNFK